MGILEHHIGSRRFILGLTALGCLTYLGLTREHDTSMAIAAVIAAVAGSNAFEASRTNPKTRKSEQKVDDEDIK